MKKEMMINAAQPEECRICIVENGILEELYVERASQESYVGNIYKGKIVNIEPSIQAAFVDFGIGRNGFLHVSDVDPVYYKHLLPKHVLDEMEAEENEEFGSQDRGSQGRRGGRDNARGGRGGRDRDRNWKEAAPPVEAPRKELTSWLSPEESVPVAPVPESDDVLPTHDDTIHTLEDEEGLSHFGEGLIEDQDAPPPPLPARRNTIVESVVNRSEAVPPPAPPRPAPAPADPDVESGFGAGLDLEDDLVPLTNDPEPTLELEYVTEETVVDVEVAPEVEVIAEVDVAPEVEAEAEASEKPKARPRSRSRAKPKAEEGTTEPEESGPKSKARPRRVKKKPEGEEPEEGTGDAPKFMPGAEHRTSPNDEPEIESSFGSGIEDDLPPPLPLESIVEPTADEADFDETFEDEPVATESFSEEIENEEIQPFFDSASTDDFDIDGPNDRFAKKEEAPSRSSERRPRKKSRHSSDRGREDRASEDRGEAEETQEFHDVPVSTDLEDDEIPIPRTKFDDEEGDGGRRRGRRSSGGGGGGRGPRRDGRGDRGPGSKPGGGRPPRDKGFPRMPIEQIFKRGQEVIVQVIKEGIGTKGPTLSTYISIAGRYLVLMPSLNRVGVSRKIEDHEARRRLRDTMEELNPPKGVGFIVRTAAVDRDPKELQNDLGYLLRLWQVVVRRIKKVAAPVEIYRESDMITRTIRDIFTKDIDTIWVDDPTAFQHAQEFLQIVMPRFAERIRQHEDSQPLFHRYRLEEEIAKLNQKRIEMPQGGSIIIEQTEALVAIDVNSGTFRAENNAEETAFRMNILAAKEIARQLRLRDLGGVIVNDFIDMREEKHRREVERTLRDALRRDRARTKILRISQFGIIEMTRQRMQQSLKKRIYNECSHCKGTGYVKTSETLGIEAMRLLQLAAHRALSGIPSVTSARLTVCQEAAYYLLNRKRRDIAALEEQSKIEITVNGVTGVSPDHLEFKCFDSNGNEVRLLQQGPPPKMFVPAGRGPRQLPDRRYSNND